MNKIKEEMLREAQAWCDAEDKSTEFMIQYMQDYAKVSFDDVMKFLERQAESWQKIELNVSDDHLKIVRAE